MISCSLGNDNDNVTSYEDTCSFTCNTGYELTGSDTRTCQSDGSWSDTDTVCGRGSYLYVMLAILVIYVATYIPYIFIPIYVC